MSNDSTTSTISSIKDGPSGDFECSTSSSQSSRYSSSCRSSFRVDNKEPKRNFQSNSNCLDTFKRHKKQENSKGYFELNHIVKTKRLEPLLPQCRRFNSAPVFSTRRLSCKLQSIDENDEQGFSTDSSASVSKSPKKCQKVVETVPRIDDTELKTPRFYEVPPKRKCIRETTPEIKAPIKCIPLEVRKHVDRCWKGDNKRIKIGDKEYIVRKTNKTATSNVSVQVDANLEEELHYNKNSKKYEAGDTSGISFSKETISQVNLPQSITDDLDEKPLALEPNIIVIDTKEQKNDKKRKKKDNVIGDVSSCSGDGSIMDHKTSDTGSLNSILKQYIETPRYSINSTPTYMVSTNYSETTLHSSARKSEIESAQVSPVKYHSNTEVIEREIKTINPESLETMNFEDFYEIADVKSYKSILIDYSSGITPTRTFPVHFDDLETLETKDQRSESTTFKQKASELLKLASSRLSFLNKQYKDSKTSIAGMSASKSINAKNTSLIDMRKFQTTDINYYLVGSSSESCVASEEDSTVPPEISSSEIHLESEEEDYCCSCFGSLRLL